MTYIRKPPKTYALITNYVQVKEASKFGLTHEVAKRSSDRSFLLWEIARDLFYFYFPLFRIYSLIFMTFSVQ